MAERRRTWLWPLVAALVAALGVTAWRLLPLLDRGYAIADDRTPLPAGACRLERESRRPRDRTVLLYYGDAGSGRRAQYAVARRMARVCHDRCCEAALVAGDNIYPSGVRDVGDPQFETKFELPMAPLLDPSGAPLLHYLALGNHDARGNVQAEIDRTLKSPRWRMPARYYSVPGLPPYITVLAIDSNDRSGAEGEQARWLAQTACASKARWKFFLGHHPVVSLGAHGANRHMRHLLDIGRRCGVTGYLAGHDHDLQHLSLQSGSGQRFEQFVNGTATYRRDDVPFCVAGRVPPDPGCREGQAPLAKQVAAQGGTWSEVQFSHPAHGFALIDASERRLEMTFYDIDGKVLYRFAQGPPTVASE